MAPDSRIGPAGVPGRSQDSPPPSRSSASKIPPGAVGGRKCAWCTGPLSRRRRRFCTDECRQRGQRAERVTETGDFGRAAVRMIRTMARRVGASDIAEFGAMWEVMTEAELAVTKAVDDLRASGYSWAEIGAEIGWSKQRLSQWRQRRGGLQRQQSVYAGIPEPGAAG